MKKRLLYLTFFLSLLGLCTVIVEAKEVAAKDVEGNSYVIGTHIFTGNTTLTTSHIMLAAKTTESNNIEDMVIYYKTPRGSWINGATGESLTAPENFNINYTDLKLEEDNDTVSAPKAPIVEVIVTKLYEETSKVRLLVNILIDDIEDENNEVNGVSLYLDNSGPIVNKELINHKEISTTRDGKSYHLIQYSFDAWLDSGYIWLDISSYASDANGKKVYSESSYQLHSLIYDIVFPFDDVLEIVEIGTSGNIDNRDNIVYTLGLRQSDELKFLFDNNNRFRYDVYKRDDYGSFSLYGTYELDEEFAVIVPKDRIQEYNVRLRYYYGDDEWKYVSTSEVFTIDSRTLTAPILSTSPYGSHLKINFEFYQNQGEDTLDYQIEGVEIYNVYWSDFELTGELIKQGDISGFVVPRTGYYAARVYATNEMGERVYSDFSDIITVAVRPEIEVSEVIDGKVNVKVSNVGYYERTFIDYYNVYTTNSDGDEVVLGRIGMYDDQIDINVTENMEIYVRAAVPIWEEQDMTPEYLYSENSNKVNVVVE